MSRIKFSHDYLKFKGQKNRAQLVALKVVEYEILTPELIEYDTKTVDGKYYPLPKTKLIKLFFDGDKGIPFCTLRRYTPEKFEYYKSLIDKVLEVHIDIK